MQLSLLFFLFLLLFLLLSLLPKVAPLSFLDSPFYYRSVIKRLIRSLVMYIYFYSFFLPALIISTLFNFIFYLFNESIMLYQSFCYDIHLNVSSPIFSLILFSSIFFSLPIFSLPIFSLTIFSFARGLQRGRVKSSEHTSKERVESDNREIRIRWESVSRCVWRTYVTYVCHIRHWIKSSDSTINGNI